jgi:ABC-type sugar transport system substrate-binding protein
MPVWAVWLDGSIYFDGSPNHGSQFLELALKIINGEEMPGQVLVEEGIFSPEDAEALLPTGKY